MKTFEDDVRDMLRRRAEDVTSTAPPWRQLDVVDLHRPTQAPGRARRLAAAAAVAALVVGIAAVQLGRRQDAAPPPAVDTRTTDAPPFDPESSSAIWPVGREGSSTSWFRTAFDEGTRLQPPPSDDPNEVAMAYLRDRFGPMAVTLADTAEHGAGTAMYHWRVRVDTQDSTGRVYLRRIVLPNSFPVVGYAWVVVGATSDHVRVDGLRSDDGRLRFELARHDAPFATAASVQLPTGTSTVDLDRPRSFDVALDQPATIRVQLLGGAALTLTEFRVEPPYTAQPGKSLANLGGELWSAPAPDAVSVAAHYLRERFDVDELRVEPATDGTDDVRYTSTTIGSGTVRIERDAGRWAIEAIVGDGLSVESMLQTDDVRRLTLSSALPGRVSAVLRDNAGEAIGQGSTRLPGVDMLAGLPVTMTSRPALGTAPVVELRVEGPQGTTVAVYCLPG